MSSETSRPPFFPMMIDLHARKVLLIGGGKIASRRARTLLKCGAEIVAISPEFCDEFPDDVQKIFREFRPEDVNESFALVIAATSSREVNHLVHDIAKIKHVLINVADCQDECDFFFPSLITSGNIAASVNSAGISSRLTHRLSERLRKVWASWVKEETETLITSRSHS